MNNHDLRHYFLYVAGNATDESKIPKGIFSLPKVNGEKGYTCTLRDVETEKFLLKSDIGDYLYGPADIFYDAFRRTDNVKTSFLSADRFPQYMNVLPDRSFVVRGQYPILGLMFTDKLYEDLDRLGLTRPQQNFLIFPMGQDMFGLSPASCKDTCDKGFTTEMDKIQKKITYDLLPLEDRVTENVFIYECGKERERVRWDLDKGDEDGEMEEEL